MENKPNVLLIIADQQRYDTINALGYDYMITPNLDRLVKEGCSFTNCYSHNPVCMPARHDLLIGMPASTHGYYANKKKCIDDYEAPTIPRVFGSNSYRTAAIGKSHFYPAREHHGYHHLSLCEELPTNRQDDEYAKYLEDNNLGNIQNIHGIRPLHYYTPQKSNIDEKHYETNWVANETINWLENNGDNPFMLTVGYIKPHPPFDIPKKYKNMYKDANIKEPIPISRCEIDNGIDGKWYGDNDTDEQKRIIREGYLTCVSMVDESVGKILDYLEEKGTLDNTIIIYTSDHGEMLQDKGYYAKELPYESSAKIPFIVRYPKLFKKGSINKSLVSLMDIFPTLLDVANLNYPSDNYQLYGSSLVELEENDRETVVSASGFLGATRWIMVRDSRYKYIYHYGNGCEELFDLQDDPQELINIINKLKNSDIYNKLKKVALNYEEQYGPKGAIVNGDFKKFQVDTNSVALHAKYMSWCNYQFQNFQNDSKEEKGKRFLTEIQEALSDKEISGVGLKDTLRDDKWINNFSTHFEKYANYKDYKKIIWEK